MPKIVSGNKEVAEQQLPIQNLDPTPAEVKAQEVHAQSLKSMTRERDKLLLTTEKLKERVQELALEKKQSKQAASEKMQARIQEHNKEKNDFQDTIKDRERTIVELSETIALLTAEVEAFQTASRIQEPKVPGLTGGAAGVMKSRAETLEQRSDSLFKATRATILEKSDDLDPLLDDKLVTLAINVADHNHKMIPISERISAKVTRRDQLFTDLSVITLLGMKTASKLEYTEIVKNTPEQIRQLLMRLEHFKERQKMLPSTHTEEIAEDQYQLKVNSLEELKGFIDQLKQDKALIQVKALFDTINTKADAEVVAPTAEDLKALHAYNQDTENALREGIVALRTEEKARYAELRSDTSKKWNAMGEGIALLETEVFISEISLKVQLLMYALQSKSAALRDKYFTMRDNKTAYADLNAKLDRKCQEFSDNVREAAVIHEAYKAYTDTLKLRIENEKSKTSLNRELEEATLNPATPEAAVRASLVKMHQDFEQRLTQVQVSLEGSFTRFNDVMRNYGQAHGYFLAAIEGGKATNTPKWPYGITWNAQAYQAADPIKTVQVWKEELLKRAQVPAPEPAPAVDVAATQTVLSNPILNV